MRYFVRKNVISMICLTAVLLVSAAGQVDAYEVTLSLYTQGFDINKFYNDGDFDVQAGIVEADPTALLVIVGDPANVEETLQVPENPDPFNLAEAGSDFHFGEFQPFRFPDRFDGLFSTTVDDPTFFLTDNGTVTAFRDDGILADDRIDLTAYAPELPAEYYEVDFGDTTTMMTDDGTNLYITRFVRNADYSVTFDISDVPEPGTILLFGVGLFGLFGTLRKRSKQGSIPFIIILTFCCLLPSTASAIEIGPEFCAYQSYAICGQFQNTYHSDLGLPTSQASLKCYGPDGSAYPFIVIDSCPNFYKESWTQYYQKGYITCENGNCLGYSTAFDPENPEEPLPVDPPEDPKLTSIEGPACIGLDGWGLKKKPQAGGFKLNFSPYTPRVALVKSFSPSELKMDSPSWFSAIFGTVNSLNPSLSSQLIGLGHWSRYMDSLTKQADLNVTVGHPGDPDKYGSASTSVTLVNESASVGFQLGATPFGLSKNLDDIVKFMKDANKIIDKFSTFEKVLNEIKKIPNSKWDFKKPLSGGLKELLESLSANVGVELSKQCCSPTVKTKYKVFGGFGANLVEASFDSPRVPVGYGFFVGITGKVGVSVSSNTSSETTCGSLKICFDDTEIDADLGGGVYGEFLDECIARADLMLIGRASVENMGICYEFGRGIEIKKPQICFAPKVAGEVKLFSFVKTSIEANLGRKACL